MLYLALAMSGFLGLTHFFGEELDEHFSGNSLLLASFSAGFTVSYFFLAMLPEMSSASKIVSFEFFFALMGFSLLYVIEEFVYERESNLSQVRKGFKEVHTLFISSYHFVIGFLLYFLILENTSQALLFYIPVLMHSAVNSVAIKEMHEEMLDILSVKLLASFSAVLGVILSYFVTPSSQTAYSIFGLVGGMFLYVVVHDALDPKRERPLGFITGSAAFILLLSLL
jgi:4-hydroxybenzoate polyprenyltransferase